MLQELSQWWREMFAQCNQGSQENDVHGSMSLHNARQFLQSVNQDNSGTSFNSTLKGTEVHAAIEEEQRQKGRLGQTQRDPKETVEQAWKEETRRISNNIFSPLSKLCLHQKKPEVSLEETDAWNRSATCHVATSLNLKWSSETPT